MKRYLYLVALAALAGCATPPTASPPSKTLILTTPSATPPPAQNDGQTPSTINADTIATLRDQRAALRAWAKGHALTTLAANARQADEKFLGVRRMAALLPTLDYRQPLDVVALTFRNPDYWRGVMEMSPGNHLVAAMPVFLFAANGEFDQASRLGNILLPFSTQGAIADSLMREFFTRYQAYRTLLESELRRGIGFHDRQKFREAIAIYNALLTVCPDSAWAHYELFFSSLWETGPKGVIEDARTGSKQWPAAAAMIYRCDPLYSTQYSGERGTTLAALKDRLALGLLFEKQPKEPAQFFSQYADLALKLEAYGYAANLYWFSLGLKDTDLTVEQKLARYLYCLEKLGVGDIKKNFKGDLSAEFSRLDRELAAHRSQ